MGDDTIIIGNSVQVGVKITVLTKNSETLSYILNEPVYVMINGRHPVELTFCGEC